MSMKELKTIIKDLDRSGVYFFYNDKKELFYIGMSKNLQGRIYQSNSERNAKYVSFAFTDNEDEAILYEAKCIKEYKPYQNSTLVADNINTDNLPEIPQTDLYEITDGISYPYDSTLDETVVIKNLNNELKNKFKAKVTKKPYRLRLTTQLNE